MNQKKDSHSKNLQTKIFELFDNKEYDIDLETVKKEHQKAYKKRKNKEYAKKFHRETIRFTFEEIADLSVLAQRHGMKRAPFLKALIFAYIKDLYVLPSDHQVRQLELEIGKISQSVSESIRYVHLNQNITKADIEEIKKQIHELEIQVSDMFRKAPSIKLWLQDQVNQDERFIVRLQALLDEIKHDNQNDSHSQ